MSGLPTSRLAMNSHASIVPILGFAIFQITAATTRLGIPDLLDTAKTVDELAEETGADTNALFRLLRAAAAVGLLTMSGDRFELTELGETFRTDSPVAAGVMVALNSSGPVWQAWGGLTYSVLTGRPAFDYVHGAGIFEYLEGDPDLARIFHTAMGSGTLSQIPQLVRHYDFGGDKHIVDVGGGNGTHLAAILNLDERLRGTVFDTMSGVQEATTILSRAGVADRCDIVVGDFFASVPAGADVYVLKNIIVDWDDDSCVKILDNCRRAMNPDGRIVVVGTIMPEDISTQSAGDVLPACIFDISLMVQVRGRERTLAQYEELFAKAGLSLGKVTAVTADSSDRTTSLFHVIEALPINKASSPH